MIKVTINPERCKACGLCIAHCPKKLLQPSPKLNEVGYHNTVQNEPENCNGCAICALMCPDVCFTITRTEDAGAKAEEGQP
jgi:2-oxoglutarate ferredoxin oxidoreductase subunit delta